MEFVAAVWYMLPMGCFQGWDLGDACILGFDLPRFDAWSSGFPSDTSIPKQVGAISFHSLNALINALLTGVRQSCCFPYAQPLFLHEHLWPFGRAASDAQLETLPFSSSNRYECLDTEGKDMANILNRLVDPQVYEEVR